jgi:hypothetical protein
MSLQGSIGQDRHSFSPYLGELRGDPILKEVLLFKTEILGGYENKDNHNSGILGTQKHNVLEGNNNLCGGYRKGDVNPLRNLISWELGK